MGGDGRDGECGEGQEGGGGHRSGQWGLPEREMGEHVAIGGSLRLIYEVDSPRLL